MLKSWHIICLIVGIRNYFTGEGQALCEIRKVVIQKRVDDHNQTNKRGIAIMTCVINCHYSLCVTGV